MFPRVSLTVALLVLGTQAAVAQTTTVEVTIQGVKSDAKEISVAYRADAAEKIVRLDVSRKAEIALNGKRADLGSLTPGLKARIEYDRALEIVTKIEASGETRAAPRLVEVSELKRPYAPCLSENGLIIYFEKTQPDKEPAICTAHRRDAESFFEQEKDIFEGRQPVVTNDGLEMILVAKDGQVLCFHSSTRDSVEQSFRRPKPIRELRDPPGAPWSRNAYLSADALTLYFMRYRTTPDGKAIEHVITTRPDRKSAWTEPKVMKLAGSNLFPRSLTTRCVTEDRRVLLITVEAPSDWMLAKGNLLKFTRASTAQDFGNPEFVEIKGLPKLVGRFPQYIDATKELFFLQSDEGNFGKFRLIIIKNFVP